MVAVADPDATEAGAVVADSDATEAGAVVADPDATEAGDVTDCASALASVVADSAAVFCVEEEEPSQDDNRGTETSRAASLFRRMSTTSMWKTFTKIQCTKYTTINTTMMANSVRAMRR